MNNFKKAVLASVAVAGLTIGASANAAIDPSAVVVWTGKIPALNQGDELLITGMSGDLSPQSSVLAPNVDGTFISPSIILEAHANDGTSADDVVVGDLTPASWTVKAVDVVYGGSAQTDQEVVVYVNDAEAEINGASFDDVESITISVEQTAVLAADVSGKDVQAAVTVMATAPAAV